MSQKDIEPPVIKVCEVTGDVIDNDASEDAYGSESSSLYVESPRSLLRELMAIDEEDDRHPSVTLCPFTPRARSPQSMPSTRLRALLPTLQSTPAAASVTGKSALAALSVPITLTVPGINKLEGLISGRSTSSANTSSRGSSARSHAVDRIIGGNISSEMPIVGLIPPAVERMQKKKISSILVDPLDLEKLQSRNRPHSLVELSRFTKKDSHTEFIREREGVLADLCEALDPVLGWTQCFATSIRLGRILQNLILFLFSFVGVFGLYGSLQCMLFGSNKWQFNARGIAQVTLIAHFAQCLLSVWYVRQTNVSLPKIVEVWLETYSNTTAEYTPLQQLKWCGRIFGWCYVGFGSLFFVSFVLTSCMAPDIVLFPDDCDCFTPGVYIKIPCVNEFLGAMAIVPNLYMQGVYSLLCAVLYYEFERGEKVFSESRADVASAQRLATFRLDHFQVICLNDLVDTLFSYYTWWAFSLNLPIVSLIFYVLILEQLTAAEMTAFSVWAMQLVAQMILVSVPPAFVCHRAHAPQKIVQRYGSRPPDRVSELFERERRRESCTGSQVSSLLVENLKEIASTTKQQDEIVSESPRRISHSDIVGSIEEVDKSLYWVTQEFYEEFMLFLDQLKGRTIGITCGGFFVLSKEVLMTLLSVMITYFTLILQMDISASSVCTCNCNANATTTTTRAPVI